MKKILFACFLATFCVALISCSEDSPDDPNDPNDPSNPSNPGNVEMYLTKEVENLHSSTGNGHISLYFYDSSKRLAKIAYGGDEEVNFIYNADGTFNKYINIDYLFGEYTERFLYENNKIKKVIGSDDQDTLYLFYNNEGNIKKTVYNRHGWRNSFETADYTTDNKGRITQKITYYKDFMAENSLFQHYIDTLSYQYSSENNLINSTRNRMDLLTNEWSWEKYVYEYDTKKNYFFTKHYPKEYLFIEMLEPDPDYSANNVILKTTTTSTGNYESIIHNIKEYSSDGYPLSISTNWVNIELEYEEIE